MSGTGVAGTGLRGLFAAEVCDGVTLLSSRPSAADASFCLPTHLRVNCCQPCFVVEK